MDRRTRAPDFTPLHGREAIPDVRVQRCETREQNLDAGLRKTRKDRS